MKKRPKNKNKNYSNRVCFWLEDCWALLRLQLGSWVFAKIVFQGLGYWVFAKIVLQGLGYLFYSKVLGFGLVGILGFYFPTLSSWKTHILGDSFTLESNNSVSFSFCAFSLISSFSLASLFPFI